IGRRPRQVLRHGRPPGTRRLEPRAQAGQGDPAQPGTRGRGVPTVLAHIPPARRAHRRLVPDGNHRPALPLLMSFAPNTPTARLPGGPASGLLAGPRDGATASPPPQASPGDHAMSTPAQPPARYRIRIRGHPDPA